MVYVDPTELKWMPYVKSWLDTLPDALVKNEHRLQIIELFGKYFEEGLIFCRKNCVCPILQVYNLSRLTQRSRHNFSNIIVPSTDRLILVKQV